MQPLLNKIVWVTGAGSGIGEAAARTLAKAGGAVVLTGRRREPLETVAHRIRAEGGTAHVEPGDLMDPDAVKRVGAAIAWSASADKVTSQRPSGDHATDESSSAKLVTCLSPVPSGRISPSCSWPDASPRK